jgi:vitamin B12 transporter
MFRILIPIFFIFTLSMPAFALEATEPQNRASVSEENLLLTEFKASDHLVNDLLLFYDYEDLLVDAPSRRPTKIQYVAENISVITAEDIASMNAHSINEILRIVTGIFLSLNGGNFSGGGSLSIHGSSYEYVLILIDGVRLNDVDAGWPEAEGIPVQIIDRIEIIKGPASSAWGSSLGGIINIITKDTGNTSRPSVNLYASYGEGKSQDQRVDAAGRAGKHRYYIYAGRMYSDGLVDDKYHKNNSFYAKITSELSKDLSLTFTAGHWHPDNKKFDIPASDRSYFNNVEHYLITGKMDADLSPDLKLNIGLHFYSQDWENTNRSLATDAFTSSNIWDNDMYGGSANLVWERGRHSMLIGAEFDHGQNTRHFNYASAPSIVLPTETRKDWAIYFNDTVKLEKLTLIPGVRYDHLSIKSAGSDDIVSPSLGATYRIEQETLLRATVSHGFIRRSIGLTVGTVGYAGDPEQQPESIWSFQGGIESNRFRNVHLKADLFHHRQDDTIYWDSVEGLWINGGVSKRTGFELNAAASPFENFTGSIGYTHVRIEPYGGLNDNIYSLNTKLRYSTPRLGSLTLFGSHFWLSETLSATDPEYDNMIWELHYNKDIYSKNDLKLNIFASVRNLFNSSYYWNNLLKDSERWVEAGVRVRF